MRRRLWWLPLSRSAPLPQFQRTTVPASASRRASCCECLSHFFVPPPPLPNLNLLLLLLLLLPPLASDVSGGFDVKVEVFMQSSAKSADKLELPESLGTVTFNVSFLALPQLLPTASNPLSRFRFPPFFTLESQLQAPRAGLWVVLSLQRRC